MSRTTYRVKAIFGPTLQGEGPHAGRSCLFVRLAGCNAWDGRPETRADSACPYCDTDFRGGENMALAAIDRTLQALRPPGEEIGCVLSGGEPLLQADSELLELLGERFAWVDVETNGTRPCPLRPQNVYLSCSPKYLPAEAIIVEPDWWKILIPAQDRFLDMALASGQPVFVQPVCPDAGPSGSAYEANLARCVALCHAQGCRLSLQLHKYAGLP